MKIIINLLLTLFLLFFHLETTSAQTSRYAECDVCGYCKGKTVPSNWADCAQCMYSNIRELNSVGSNQLANSNLTLKIETDPSKSNFNRPPEPRKGRFYTQLGCFGNNLVSFDSEAAPGELVNFILTNLIFPTVGTLGFIAIIYGGFMLATAQGDVYKIQQSKKLIGGAIVGVIFTYSIILIVNIIGSDILKIPTNSGPYGKISINGNTVTADFSLSSGPNYKVGVAKCNQSDCRELVENYWSGDSCTGDGFLPSNGSISGKKNSWCMVDINLNETGIITWSITNPPDGTYVLVVSNTLNSGNNKKCSGNPICSVNGGSDTCEGWLSCSDSDYLIVP